MKNPECFYIRNMSRNINCACALELNLKWFHGPMASEAAVSYREGDRKHLLLGLPWLLKCLSHGVLSLVFIKWFIGSRILELIILGKMMGNKKTQFFAGNFEISGLEECGKFWYSRVTVPFFLGQKRKMLTSGKGNKKRWKRRKRERWLRRREWLASRWQEFYLSFPLLPFGSHIKVEH